MKSQFIFIPGYCEYFILPNFILGKCLEFFEINLHRLGLIREV